MTAFLLVLAVMVGAWFLAIGMCQAGARDDRARERAAARHRGDVVDIGTARRRRNGAALARRGGDVA